ncbi:glycosyl transferase [Bifidobacterium margollesii]|uniref:Glycosyl transferase n=1 Tax=Bifidobacterium margollesii TaxID=2020964 RepID=A0A2N5JBQ6_9BIFI|nr:glycosyltransferase [Bifidobacterium margollesii]PLS31638.1 glycosyl transferase [Bifidobacterium margollesii]
MPTYVPAADNTVKTENILVSFLIPVYNAEDRLPATLDSIVAQDDGTIEIICVDDGSKDGSGKVLEEYAQRYPFIHVITQENQGITCARNTALAQATGEWLCFVDNDDIVAEDAVKVFHQTAEPDLDIVYYDYEKFTTDLPNQVGNHVGDSSIIEGDALIKLQSDCINRFRSNTPLISHKTMPTPWAKIYRRAFLTERGLKFRPEVKHEEDVVFNFEVLSYCRKAKKVDYVSYYYRWSVKSESHRYRPDLADDAEKTLAAYRDIIARRYPNRADMRMLYDYRVLWELLYCTVLGPIHPMNPESYAARRAQFNALLSRPMFAAVLANRHVRTTLFEMRQSVLATLIRLRCFWILNQMGKIVGKAR